MSDDGTFQIDTGAGPGFGPTTDFALLKEMVKAWAEIDVASGSYDLDTVQVIEGPLPREKNIVHMVARLKAENLQHALGAQSINRAAVFRAEFGDSVSRRDGDLLDNAVSIDEMVAAEEEKLAAKKAEAEATESVLRGEVPWRDGATRTAPVPATPVLPADNRGSVASASAALTRRRELVNRWFVDVGFSVVSGIPEAFILVMIFSVALRTDNWMETFATVFGVTLLATAVPHVIGMFISQWVRGGPLKIRAVAFVAFLIASWVTTAFVASNLRVSAQRTRTINNIALQQGIAPEEVDLTGQFDATGELFLWAIVIMTIGVFIIAMKVAFWNPALTSLLRLQNGVILSELKLENLRGRRARIEANLELLEGVDADTAKSFEHHLHTLDKLQAELLSLYRTTFINALSSPEMTAYLGTDAEEK